MKTKLCGIGLLICWLAFCGPIVCAQAALSEEEIPEALAPWRSWVLYGHEEALCPSLYNDGRQIRCQWPARLKLDVEANGGRFEQRWLIFSRGWVPLPGGGEHWPDAVAVNDRSVAVIERGGRPMVALTPGEYHITGRFFWGRPPEMLQIPPSLGILSLTLEGRPVRSPRHDDHGRLWLRPGEAAAEGREWHRVQVFRLFADTIPMQVTTLLKLEIAGPGRELVFPNVLMPNAIAMRVESQLPARIDNQGRLVIQARTGKWEVSVQSRLPGPVFRLDAGAAPYENEIWSFQPQHHLRMVELEGLPPVEPGRTEMPPAWHRWSAFQVTPNAVMTIKEIRRGDPDPSPDRLNLHRIWWLDFNGGGFTVHDRLSGSLSRRWFLSVKAPMELGRAAVDGEDRVITRQGPQGQAGLELRRGRLDLQADSRLPVRAAPLPALGWDNDVESLSGVLNLPPGWRLIGATGIDQLSDSWLQRWSLLDFFLVLIISLAILKLRSWRWGLVALAAMVLTFHEPGAPRLVWLHLLAVMALLPLLPEGWFRRLVMLWGLGAAVMLVVIIIPFMIAQLRWAVYPQLAPPVSRLPAVDAGRATTAMSVPALREEMVAKQPPMQKALVSSLDQAGAPPAAPPAWQADPDALIPTGPGLPDWQWQSVALRWNGPVSGNQQIRFYLWGPTVNLLACLFRVGLLAALLCGLYDWRTAWRRMRPHVNPAVVLLIAALFWAPVGETRAAGTETEGFAVFPPPALLETLRQRLLEKADCLPHCADISRLELSVSDDQLQILLKVHAAQRTAVPLPVSDRSWTPDQILLDSAPISGLFRDEKGQLWGLVTAGLHTLILLADIGHLDVLQIPLPLKPHMAAFATPGWDLKGIQPDGGVGAGLQLIRQQAVHRESANQEEVLGLPSFFQVRRSLQLGLSWQVTTTVSRLTPPGAPVVISIPLLEGESVITPGVSIAQGEALVTLAADQRAFSYQSTLAISSEIRLMAHSSVPWTEVWELEASPVWHCDMEGIAAIHHQNQGGTWQPQWHPWPGEQVTIRVQRPQAIAGRQVTIDRADLDYIPGRRFATASLSLGIRTSRGEQFTVELPPKANLQQVTVNGQSLPVRQDGIYVTVPLQPGAQTVAVGWHQPSTLSTWFSVPAVKIGHPAVNARVSVQMPNSRWILMVGGPRWGPAVLFWSYLVVVLLAAVALGRIPLTPLGVWGWLLLGLGLTQIPPLMALVIVGWLLVLALRQERPMTTHWMVHNLVQIGLVLWTLVALICLFAAVKAGLVGQPDMQITGNQSYALQLHWTQDHIGGHMPRPWVLSLPVWSYRVLMLAWSLWLAWALLGWLRWGWRCFSSSAVWRRKTPKQTPA